MDSLTPENHLICERLLGWTPSRFRGIWFPDSSYASVETPGFDTAADAKLIKDAFRTRRVDIELDNDPAAVRAAALEYIKAVKP